MPTKSKTKTKTGNSSVKPKGPTKPAQYLAVQTIRNGEAVGIKIENGVAIINNTGSDPNITIPIDPTKLVIVSVSQ